MSARRITLDGRVQGVGFRPFVYRLAHAHAVHGWVYNDAGSVLVQAEADEPVLERFTAELISQAPPLARPHLVRSEPVAPEGHRDFCIRESHADSRPRIHVPPDYFLCDDCLAELRNPQARRYRYPFINCTQCGPRYTIIRSMPYDRPNTTMAGFPLCPECAAEYGDSMDRRFHAQPLACPVCGPRLTFQQAGSVIEGNEAALAACVAALSRGEIIAVRGIGGYHLLCDAANATAVASLRTRKHRPHKPLAVMVPLSGEDGLDWARRLASLDTAQAALLIDPMRPIVLVPKLPNTPLADNIAPGLNEVGLMLPYSPLHHLLLGDFKRPLVATSGNISGEPVLTQPEDVEQRLGKVVDGCLHHDRPIQRPADDPVFRLVAEKLRPIRIGRGNAPLEMRLDMKLQQPLLAAGAFLKNTVALAWDDRVIVSPHIGDLASPRSRQVFQQVAEDLQSLYGVRVERIVCDAHPDFPNSRWAKTTGLPLMHIYHHHAHAAAAVGEYSLIEPCLCFTWDGVGFGEDGTLWGGEALLGRPGAWQRIASFRPFRLPGGELAAREPWRSALGVCWETGSRCAGIESNPLLHHAWQNHVNSPLTTAIGRLFDAAAALTSVVTNASFEGQGPMQLEALCREPREPVELPLYKDSNGLRRSNWAPLLQMLMDTGTTAAVRAERFHSSLAHTLLAQAQWARRIHGVNQIALAGGVFQNDVLTTQVRELLLADGFNLYIPERMPVNDAAISFGQIIEAGARLRRGL
ncbi:MAG: carbamoyltransferase HypF [Gammaproteobacteria bacterium]|nr:carbamoyltransferase HypF [Gammaproteobacteria bacterium]MDE2346177.1 carbamoyltransferase HypF [Gammaproteobacteria bacterium]